MRNAINAWALVTPTSRLGSLSVLSKYIRLEKQTNKKPERFIDYGHFGEKNREVQGLHTLSDCEVSF